MKIYAGPRLLSHMKFGPPPAKSLSAEYGALELSMEVVDDVESAMQHIYKYGSSHTDAIVTENGEHFFCLVMQHLSLLDLKKTMSHCYIFILWKY